jgi:hypothetical protein
MWRALKHTSMKKSPPQELKLSVSVWAICMGNIYNKTVRLKGSGEIEYLRNPTVLTTCGIQYTRNKSIKTLPDSWHHILVTK